MNPLSEKDTRLLTRTRRVQRPSLLGGLVLSLIGLAYVSWAVLRFDPLGDPRENPGFDAPVARLGLIFDGYHQKLAERKAETPREISLTRSLHRGMSFSAGVMVLQLRILIGTIAALAGFAMMTVVIERARLLALIRKLEPDPPPEPTQSE